MATVKFRSAYNYGERPKPEKGVFSKFSVRYREDFKKEPHLVADGVDPLYDLIQAAAPAQMIYSIIDRYASLTDLVESLPDNGVYGDIERMPADLRSAYEYLHGLRERFDDVAKDKFDGTFGDFLEAVQNNQIRDILAMKEKEEGVMNDSESAESIQ